MKPINGESEVELTFYHGALCDSYEKQANAQGFTFGNMAEYVEKVGFGLVCAHIHGCITDGEYDKILRRFQQRILFKNIEPLAESERIKLVKACAARVLLEDGRAIER